MYFLVAVLLPLIAGMLATAIIVDQHLAGLPTATAASCARACAAA